MKKRPRILLLLEEENAPGQCAEANRQGLQYRPRQINVILRPTVAVKPDLADEVVVEDISPPASKG